jgi:metallo-beta-lactamase family protein
MLSFLGGAGSVTGSRFLIETGDARVLVDCGLHQGEKELRLLDREPFAVAPETLDAAVVTHAHVDHVGYLPRLIRLGFRGPVYATRGTVELARIVLPDSGHLQEEDASYANRKGFSKHHPALPLYTERDAIDALDHLTVATAGEPIEVAAGVRATFRSAGHILGSSVIEIETNGATIAFTGDLGRPCHPLLLPPAAPSPVDTVVTESTYGNRYHRDIDVEGQLGAIIERTVGRGGTVVIPAFAVDRTELVLFHLSRLFAAGRLPAVPVFVDSPMALAALGVYRCALHDRWPETRPEVAGLNDPFALPQLEEVRDVERSKALDRLPYPSILVSASGMATGGRVLHHLAVRLPDHRNAIVLVGFQASGTRGRSLLEGAQHLKMLGRDVPVRAEIAYLPALSVHADAHELVAWLTSAPAPPKVVYAVHGEPTAAEALCRAIRTRLGATAVVPRRFERVTFATA